MSHLPPIFVPPCDELTIVVFDLHGKLAAGELLALPKTWRNDLATLRTLCVAIPSDVAAMLREIEALPDEEERK